MCILCSFVDVTWCSQWCVYMLNYRTLHNIHNEDKWNAWINSDWARCTNIIHKLKIRRMVEYTVHTYRCTTPHVNVYINVYADVFFCVIYLFFSSHLNSHSLFSLYSVTKWMAFDHPHHNNRKKIHPNK